MSRWIPRELRSHALSLAVVSAAFLVGRALAPPARLESLEVDELRCTAFTLVHSESGAPLVRIREKPDLGAWGLFVLDDEGRERAQLIVLRHSDNPQLMFLDEAYGGDDPERMGYRLNLSLTGKDSEPRITLHPKAGRGLAEIAVREQGGSKAWYDGVESGPIPAGGSFIAIPREGEVFQAP